MRDRIPAAALVFLLAGCGSGGDRPPELGSGNGDAGAQAVVPFDGGPTDIPLTVAPLTVTLPDAGAVAAGYRLALDFGMGGAMGLKGFLDTGSEGLQVLESALPAEAMAAIQSRGVVNVTEEFQSGIQAIGVMAKATVTLGDRTTPAPIPILVVESFSCQAGAACAGQPGPLSNFIFGEYQAIVGVGLRNTPASLRLGSPIPQLPGQPSFVVEAPSYGGTGGTLHIGPSAAEVATYPTLQLQSFAGGAPLLNGTPAWDDTAVPACVQDHTAGNDYCASAILDTGSPETVVFWTGETGIVVIDPGSDVAVTVGPTTAPIAEVDVTVGDTPMPGLDAFVLAPPVPGTGSLINLGLTVFFRYSVYFDPVGGRIGLRAP